MDTDFIRKDESRDFYVNFLIRYSKKKASQIFLAQNSLANRTLCDQMLFENAMTMVGFRCNNIKNIFLPLSSHEYFQNNTLESMDTGKDSLNRTPDVWESITKIKKWYYLKLKCFYTAKDTITLLKR